MTSIVIVGGGIIGAAAAFELSSRGANVTVLDASDRPGTATEASFAWINANAKLPKTYFDLNVAGMHEHRLLHERLGAETALLRWSGNTEWATSPSSIQQLETRVERLRDWGYAAEWVTTVVLAAFEPDIVVPDGVDRLAHFPDEGYIDSVLLARTLLTQASVLGAHVRRGQRVARIEQSGGRVTGVVTSAGESFGADIVVVAAGFQSPEVLAMAGLTLPMAPTVGMIAVSSPLAETLRGVHHDELMHIRPASGGRVVMRHYDFDRQVQPNLPPADSVLTELRERVATVLPSVAHAQIESAHVAIRPIPADGYPAIGFTEIGSLYLIVTHSGVTLGPLLGRLAAEELLESRVSQLLDPFRPARLL